MYRKAAEGRLPGSQAWLACCACWASAAAKTHTHLSIQSIGPPLAVIVRSLI